MLTSLALAVAGLPLAAATTTGLVRAAAAPAPAWKAYVADQSSGNVTPIDTTTGSAGTPIGVGPGPVGIAITADGKKAYVTNSGSTTVTPIDTATDTAGTPIAVGSTPVGIAITPDGKTAYVDNYGSNSVTPINTAINAAGTPIGVGSLPEAIAVTPDGKAAYVVNYGSNSVTPIDTASNTAGTPIGVGDHPRGIAITPDGKTAYVTNYDSNSVTPIDTATNTAGPPIGVDVGPIGIAVTPDGKTVYVGNSNGSDVTPIDTATNTAGAPIGVANPSGIAITPDGKAAYVSNYGSSSVTPINTATNTAGSPIGVGLNPRAVAVTPDQAPVARLSVTPNHADAPTNFDAGASTVAYGTIASYAWNFGDGSTATTTSPTTSHSYVSAGAFNASVTETSSGGTSTSQAFTGQTMSKNGGPSAVASKQVDVSATAPGAPTGVSATPGDSSAAVYWTPPPSNGSPISYYTVTSSPGDKTAVTTTNSATVAGLTNGTTYTFTVTATNAVGTGPSSPPSNPVTPGAPNSAPPGAPLAVSPQFGVRNQTDVFSVANNGAVQVSWLQAGGHWNGPLSISQPGLAPPGAHLVASAHMGVPNQTDVFVVGNNGATQTLWVDGAGQWNGPLAITPTSTAPADAALAVSNQFGMPNQTDVFVVGNDGAIRVSWVAGAGAWKGPMSITPTSTALAGAALAVSNQFGIPNQTDVFVVGNDGAIRVSWVAGAGAWKGPSAISPSALAPAGASLAASAQFGAPNQTDVFVVNETGATQVFWVQAAGRWQGPLQI